MSSARSNQIILENQAIRLREEMQVRSTDSVSIHQILKYKHIVAFFRPMGDHLSGMAIKVQKSGDAEPKRFMLINTSDVYCKQRFTCAHELYHLLFQAEFQSSYDVDVYGSKDPEEVNANKFATYLLLPETGLRQLIPMEEQRKDKITMATLLMLEHNYRCSHQALLFRLRHLDIVTESFLDAHQNHIMQTALEYGYNLSLYKPTNNTELVGDYNVKARALYDAGKISQAKYYSYLRDMDINGAAE